MSEAERANRDTPSGVAYGLAAYIWWGVIPPYIGQMKVVPPVEILAHRIVLSTGFLLVYLAAIQRLADVRDCLLDAKRRRLLLLSSMIVGLNWFIFIHAVTSGNAVEGALGYFINPLLNALMGALVFRERLRLGQKLAVVLAAFGVVILISQTGRLPWIALGLAVTWGTYGLVRKVTPVDGVLGVTIESIFLFPLAACYLVYLLNRQSMGFAEHGMYVEMLVVSTGIVMTIPMIFFGQAARRLRLTTLGFLQYISPTMQFVLAITIMGETFESKQVAGYVLVWISLGIYLADTWLGMNKRRREALVPTLQV